MFGLGLELGSGVRDRSSTLVVLVTVTINIPSLNRQPISKMDGQPMSRIIHQL